MMNWSLFWNPLAILFGAFEFGHRDHRVHREIKNETQIAMETEIHRFAHACSKDTIQQGVPKSITSVSSVISVAKK